MALKLLSIQFRDVPQKSQSTIPLRPAPDKEPFGLPEWPGQGGASVAWRLDKTLNSAPVIEMQLVSDQAGKFTVQAKDDTRQNLSGAINPFEVELTANAPIAIKVQLNAPRLTEAAQRRVAMHKDAWTWSAAADGSPVTITPSKTEHQAYAVLGAPVMPWGSAKPDLYVWTEALDFACCIAAGATSQHEIADKITQAIFALGSSTHVPRLRYCGVSSYCPISRPAAFALINLLRYLQNAAPTSPARVDCDDTASAVSTLANALGAALIQGKITAKSGTFNLNATVLIGNASPEEFFEHHEVAVVRQPPDVVWDACLMVDISPSPGSTPRNFGLALGMPFSSPDEIAYRERLAPREDARSLSLPKHLRIRDNRVLRALPSQLAFQRKINLIWPGRSVVRRFLISTEFPPWQLLEWYEDQITPDIYAYRTIYTLSSDSLDPRVQIMLYRCASARVVRKVLDDVLALFAIPPKRLRLPGNRRPAFQSHDCDTTVFVRRNLVVQVSDIGLLSGQIKKMPQDFDQALARAFDERALLT